MVEGKAHPAAEPEALDTRHFAAPGSYSRRRIAREARGTRPDRERRRERGCVRSSAKAQDKKVIGSPVRGKGLPDRRNIELRPRPTPGQAPPGDDYDVVHAHLRN